MRVRALRILLVALMLAFAGHAARLYTLPLLGRLDALIYDAKLRLASGEGVDPRIVIVDIDEKSLQQIGRWPWSRDHVATLLDRLFDDYQVAALGVDVVFAEPDTSSGLATLERLAAGPLKADAAYQSALKQLRPKLDYDTRLAAAIKGRPVVLGYYFGDTSGDAQSDARSSGALPPPSLLPGTFQGRPVAFPRWEGYGGNLATLQQVAAGAGHFNPLIDADGITRRVPLLAAYRCPGCEAPAYYEALSLALVRQVLGKPAIVPGYPADSAGSAYAALEWIGLPLDRRELRIPVDEDGAVLVPFPARRGHFRYVSAADVLARRVAPDILSHRIVLLGATAPGLMDLRATPLDPVYPGVELHANLVAGVLDGTIRSRPPYVVGADVLQVVVFGLLLIVGLLRLSPVRATGLTVLLVLLLVTVNLLAWHSELLVLPLAASLTMLLLMYGCTIAWGYFFDAPAMRRYAALFGNHLPPERLGRMARHATDKTAASLSQVTQAELTVVVAEIHDFTAIAESLEPDSLARLMHDYLGEMTTIIWRHGGTVDKYVGGAIIAFWGAPIAEHHHAHAAVLAALEMQQAMETLHQRFTQQGWPEVSWGLGINTGTARVGDLGTKARPAYTAVGTAVDHAVRLASMSRQYGVALIAGEDTRRQLKGQVVFRELDAVAGEGATPTVRIFEPLGLEGEVDPLQMEQLKLWNQALRAYRGQQWDQAEVALLNLVRQSRQVLYRLMMDRVAHYRRFPPGADWNGVSQLNRSGSIEG